jgi:hypothetical protein
MSQSQLVLVEVLGTTVLVMQLEVDAWDSPVRLLLAEPQ